MEVAKTWSPSLPPHQRQIIQRFGRENPTRGRI
jgi:hypothetical protein